MSSFPSSNIYLNYAILASATFGIYTLLRPLFCASNAPLNPIPSPLTTQIPNLTQSTINEFPYPPDAYPGARDVKSPYGRLRVYEFGPEDGEKVLCIHGISTPCIAFAGILDKLVKEGKRVMTFDLWGRGYSETPLLDHDNRLYTTAILLALSSSELHWTKPRAFMLIGYSLGGAIAVAFASYFPRMIRSLVLFAPGGLIRPHHIKQQYWLRTLDGVIPESLLQWAAHRSINKVRRTALRDAATEEKAGVEDADTIKAPQRPLDVPAVIEWQIAHHKGFMHSFMSSLRHGPITNQHEDWRRLGKVLSEAAAETPKTFTNGMILIILGEKDPIIIKDEIISDATDALGGAHRVEFFVVGGESHDFPITRSDVVVEQILHWQARSYIRGNE